MKQIRIQLEGGPSFRFIGSYTYEEIRAYALSLARQLQTRVIGVSYLDVNRL